MGVVEAREVSHPSTVQLGEGSWVGWKWGWRENDKHTSNLHFPTSQPWGGRGSVLQT